MDDNEAPSGKNAARSGMGIKIAIVVVLACAVGMALYLKGQKTASEVAAPVSGAVQPASPETGTKTGLPRLVDLGATKCIPCKMMAPILEDLRKTYAGKLEVVFIDVWEKPEEAKPYDINMIPTQIFYDASGKECFRHEGFFAKEDILAKWKELGVDLSTPVSAGV